ncbi:hypothetical protein Tco_0654166 [Tanacetum coccineum]|uniref:Uncharacterized protein n=1 Tax=Tanacetum coccineum TaxID=301880 RepID=A0ABQ4X2M7_9ASTR
MAYNPETAEANYLDAVRALEEADFPLVHLLKSKKDSGRMRSLDVFYWYVPFGKLPEAAYLQSLGWILVVFEFVCSFSKRLLNFIRSFPLRSKFAFILGTTCFIAAVDDIARLETCAADF